MRDPYPQGVLDKGAAAQSRFRLPLRSTASVALLSCAMLVANGQTGNSLTTYRLNQGSTFQQGCFAPCECPIMIATPVKGTFDLKPTGFDGQFDTFDVLDVRWLVPMGNTNRLYTGQGTYKVGGGQ